SGENEVSLDDVIQIYNGAVEKGILKIMSKIGISTVQSYQGAQIFEILGLNQGVVDKCFKGTVSRIEGIGFDELSVEILKWHEHAYPSSSIVKNNLEEGGIYQWKRRGEDHIFNRSEEHTSELQSRENLVCRLLLEK